MNGVKIAVAQREAISVGRSLEEFRVDVRRTALENSEAELLVYPELHLFGGLGASAHEDREILERHAWGEGDDRYRQLGAIAAENGIWLVPGSVCERAPTGEVFNTALVFSPDGSLVASYRKIFPWFPYEDWCTPGTSFQTFEGPRGIRMGLSICYDAWFPELSRHLAWMGAEVVLNIVKTTTPDRAQELVLARANSIVNQIYTVSVNCAGPEGEGQSIAVDPEGHVLTEVQDGRVCTLLCEVSSEGVSRVRHHGTAGTNRPWKQFREGDAPLQLPLYNGVITPENWRVP